MAPTWWYARLGTGPGSTGPMVGHHSNSWMRELTECGINWRLTTHIPQKRLKLQRIPIKIGPVRRGDTNREENREKEGDEDRP